MWFPKYRITCTRLETFRTWTAEHYLPAEIMNEAGFFYTQIADQVQCYFCGVTLVDWKDTDDPFMKHAKWSPECGYILDKKGRGFVNAALKNIPEKQILLTDAAQTILTLGYRPRIVKMVITQILDEKSDLTAVNLLKEIFKLEDKYPRSDLMFVVPIEKKEDQRSIENMKNEIKEMQNRLQCKICFDGDATIVFLPCGHLIACGQCSSAIKSCPICRVAIQGSVRVIIP